MTETKVILERENSLRDGVFAASSTDKSIGIVKIRMSTKLHALLSTEENMMIVDNDPALKSLLYVFDPVTRLSDIDNGNLGAMFGVPVVADPNLGERELVFESKSMIV